METASLLIELRTEELPIAGLAAFAQALAANMCDELSSLGIAVERAQVKPFYTPRRLAVLLAAVGVEQPQRQLDVLGPYCSHALAATGEPTRALLGFAAKHGVPWQQLGRMTDAKGERFVHRDHFPAVATRELLPTAITRAIAAIPMPKPMRWGDHPYAFARPVRGLVVLWEGDVVAMEAFGHAAGRVSRGHRAMHPTEVVIDHAHAYVATLRAAKILVDPDERRDRIIAQVHAVAQRDGGTARMQPDIVAQVVNLVEWPVAIGCQFASAFLTIPQEALIQAMETHQKFFPVLDDKGGLTNRFIGVADLESLCPDAVQRGYERVIRPRFADARFFFEADLKTGLHAMGEGLRAVTDHAQLGSVADTVARIGHLATAIAQAGGADPVDAARAAHLWKNDLQARLVGEFPELQGIAGRYYALAAGEPSAIAMALEEAYAPRQAADPIASSPLGRVLAIAQRADALACGFATGLKRSGNSDPYGLRRAALGLARTVIEAAVTLDLMDLLERAFSQVIQALRPTIDGGGRTTPPAVSLADRARLCADAYAFILDRLRGYYADRGLTTGHFNAVARCCPRSLSDFDQRINAVYHFSQTAAAPALIATEKRLRNLLRKSNAGWPETIDTTLLEAEAEHALVNTMQTLETQIRSAIAAKDYVTALTILAQLQPQVDAFFASVRVNDAPPRLRANRLALLHHVSQRLCAVADLEQLAQ